MEKEKKKYELTETFWMVTGRTVSPSKLNPLEWLNVIHQCLGSCGSFLREAFSKSRNDKMMTLEAHMNYSLEGSFDEKRIMSQEVLKTLPVQFTEHGWELIPVEILEKGEEKGQFFERRLFICAIRAALVVVDIKYRKDPQENQRGENDPPKINENIVSCEILADDTDVGDRKKFEEVILPYLADSEMKLGENILRYTLDPVVFLLGDMRDKVKEAEKKLDKFLSIRRLLGIQDHI